MLALRKQPSISHRVLCLILNPQNSLASGGVEKTAALSAHRTLHAMAEAFLKFSPRVAYRSPNLIFVEISTTTQFFENEELLLEAALKLCSELGTRAQAGISDSPAGAQAFAMARHGYISSQGEESADLRQLSLPLLLHLEGVKPWPQPSQVLQMQKFFRMVGCQNLGDLFHFSLPSFQERWGEMGAMLWLRLHGRDAQIISPLQANEPLHDYVHLDFPVSILALLMHEIEKSARYLFARLQGRRLFAKKLIITLHCEYSKAQHRVEIAPHTANRNFQLYIALLEDRLNTLSLENPIRQIELEVQTAPEKAQQFDLFEPRESDRDRLQVLFNLLLQSNFRPGFLKSTDSVRPEKSWIKVLEPDSTPPLSISEFFHSKRMFISDISKANGMSCDIPQSPGNPPTTRILSPPSTEISTPQTPNWPQDAQKLDSASEGRGTNSPQASTVISQAPAKPAVTSKPRYSARLPAAPRPTRLLREPQRMATVELSQLQILSRHPIERLEDSWWEDGPRRDYFFALSKSGQCLWIYQDHKNRSYYLHGYFD